MSSPQPLFYSYASNDARLRDELERHLALLRRQGVIDDWGFTEIVAGSEWDREIKTKLDTARIILLLISADFLSSEYCWGIEMSRALERHDRGDARVIPIILRDCDWQTASFAKLQALPSGAKPVNRYRRRDEAWTDIVKGIRQVALEMMSAAPEVSATNGSPAASVVRQVKELATIFVEKSLKERQVAADKVYTLARDLTTDDAVRLSASPTFGERVAAGIIIREHVQRIPGLAGTRDVERVVQQGLRDDHPKVRYRFVRAALSAPELTAKMCAVLEDIARHDTDGNVRKEAARVLTIPQKAG
jgi:hypothetical protein